MAAAVVVLLSCSVGSDSCNPRDYSHQAPLSVGFPRREYWGELPFPSPGDLSRPRIEPISPTLQVASLPLSHQGSIAALLSHKLDTTQMFNSSEKDQP